ncbi:manganese efflux pump MntP family protein [Pleomorphochaeta sp. DL1XJH-081]|jgi:putative Mn2+ efflux pump MntP|uniref:manganese efflux pump MntP n=1 Tax=Pleomorphochaeta sp. DL1XJH-081 TaxID=3409690 RepID=UPI003BB57F49
MNLAELITVFGIAVGLSMDAFAVSITQGACLEIRSLRYPYTIGITFGVFQAGMPLVGWLAGSTFSSKIQHFDHWIALLLLAVIAIKMFIDGFIDFRQKRRARSMGYACADSCGSELRFHDLMMMGIATSIDALAVGVTFGMLGINIWLSIAIIGVTTFILSTFGVLIGKRTGPLLGDKMEMIGGVVLLTLGLKILIEHLVKGI